LADARPEIRAAAARSLQSMHDASVDGILAEIIRSDQSPDVGISAMDAAKVRQPTDILLRAVETAATNGTDPHVRYRAVELLSLWLQGRSDVRPTLEMAAQNDVEQRIRERARSAL
jgi:hypothetical protein